MARLLDGVRQMLLDQRDTELDSQQGPRHQLEEVVLPTGDPAVRALQQATGPVLVEELPHDAEVTGMLRGAGVRLSVPFVA